MIRRLAQISCVMAAALLLHAPATRAQQPQTGAICVSTFADANGNGIREATETALPGVNVNLSTDGVIILTHIVAVDETQYCFDNLLSGIYSVTFTDSPTYRATTSNAGTFALDGGQRLTINDFGAVPIPTDRLRAEVAAQVVAAQAADDEPLDSSLRLLLSTVGSLAVMIFMIGVGAVILGLTGGRGRAQQQPMVPLPPPPTQIRPPVQRPRP